MPILSTTGAASARAYGAGGASLFKFTISSNQTNADLRTLALSAGWDGVSQPVATIGSGVYISSSSTGTPALTITGSFPNGVQLINSGYIVGMGGAGGDGANGMSFVVPPVGSGSSGGLALSVSAAVFINNLGTIAGGGGGGGGGAALANNNFASAGQGWGGGGGGGGQSSTTNSAGGGGGTSYFQQSRGASAGGSGTTSGAGSGGLGGAAPNPAFFAGVGGNGGSWGVAGSSGTAGQSPGQTYQQSAFGSGGAAGGAVTGNSYITWIAFGTRLGSIS
jgi:hypothetical protein